jgi:peptide/nickel transport system substrate-binding protein
VPIEEQALRRWSRSVAAGEASRRQFMRTMLRLGLTGPMAAQLLAAQAASAAATSGQATPAPFVPTRRGGGGKLRLLWWQAPTLLNAHLSSGLKDNDAARIVYEPLASFNDQGEFVPILAAAIPSLENGDLAPDGTAVTWRLKRGVVWHDGTPFTAEDVVFTWEYAADPATSAVTMNSYQQIARIERLGEHTVKVVFKQPTPYWYDAFFGNRGHILPRHLFAPYAGQDARNVLYNLKPVGTGPFQIVTFKPGDVALYEINSRYHVPHRPFFDAVELKGGGDATSAARAVIQTGEFDFAWNLQVERDVLDRLARQGERGRVYIYPGSGVEHIQLNRANPWLEVNGERSSPDAPHPFLTDHLVRQAYNLLADRHTIAQQLYGAAGQATANFLDTPPRFQSAHTRWAFSLDQANKLLDQAGWRRGSDGIRTKGGRRMKLLYQTSVNPLRQKTQAIIKKAFEEAGLEVELKAVHPSVFFSSDPGNADAVAKFNADLQMFTVSMGSPDPQAYMAQFVSWEMARKANNWSGQNVVRWSSSKYDELWQQAATELDPVKRATLFIAMNDLLVEDVVVIPLIWRNEVVAVSRALQGLELSTWDSNLWNLAYWHRQT